MSTYEMILPLKKDVLLGDVARQLLRASTSAGANYSEAQSASSYRDFHNKIRIALKEMKEAQYWICFLKETGTVLNNLEWLTDESEQLLRILSTIAKKTDPKLRNHT